VNDQARYVPPTSARCNACGVIGQVVIDASIPCGYRLAQGWAWRERGGGSRVPVCDRCIAIGAAEVDR
jgi:hypothetical protein